MPVLDLFTMARENIDHLASECANHTGAVVELAQSVEREGRLSVTMKSDRLLSFMEGGRYLNPWEECSRDAGGDETKVAQLMEERQGKKWYERRLHFEGSFVDGKKFRYGALYTGGRALIPAWGPFCAVFDMNAARLWPFVAWVPANSLERYAPDKDTFDVDRLRREVGPHEARHQVAAIKHAHEVDAWPPDEWSAKLCCDDRFVEGIVANDLVPHEVERLLAERDSWQEILRANAELIAGGGTIEQKAKAAQYRALKRSMKARNMTIAWEEV